MLNLDYGDRRPLYEQIRDKMKELIISGILEEDEKLPSVRELASTLAINPNTIQKAYKELENEGYIYSLKAKGNFVASLSNSSTDSKTEDLKDSLIPIIRELRFLGTEEDVLHQFITEIYKEENQ